VKRLAILFSFGLPLFAAENAGGEKDMTGYLWANFFILVLALGWLIRKHGGPFLKARAEAIRQGITEAEQRKAEAAGRISEVEARLATLGSEIERLKKEMRREQAAEVERVRARNAAEIEHIHIQARQEVEAAFKGVRQQLEVHAGKLALDLAEAKIRARMNPEAQRKLTREFVDSLS
jgi:F-type H+-transporting ATPase subunit b